MMMIPKDHIDNGNQSILIWWWSSTPTSHATPTMLIMPMMIVSSPNIPNLQIVLNYDIGMNCLILNGKIFHGEEARGQGEKRKFVEFSELFILLEERLSVIKYRCYLRPGSDLVSSSSKSGKWNQGWWQHEISIENMLSEVESHRHCNDKSINNDQEDRRKLQWIFEARIIETWRPNSETPGLQFKYWDPRSAVQISRLQPGLHIWTADLGSQ